MNTLVTVIIPTYKRTVEYLSRAVESVLVQTYDNIEVILVDDSPSTYQHRNEIKAYIDSLQSKNVRYFQNEVNMGGSLSRNIGIEEAQGQYITFLDDDDEYMPQKIEKQIAYMQEYDYDLTFSNMIMYNSDGYVVDFRDYSDVPITDNTKLLKYHLMRHLTGTPTFMFKAEKLRGIGGFEDAKMGQEFYLMLKSIENGLLIGYLPECDVKVYKHTDGGISQGHNKISGEKNLYEFKKKYFERFTIREKMFIRFRHWAVMVVAYKRNYMYLKMIGAAIIAFFTSPIDFFSQVYKNLVKVINHRKES